MMTEIDLGIPGGSPEPAPFSKELWEEWIADHPEHWEKIVAGVVGGYKTYSSNLEESAKNSEPGSQD